MIVDSRQNIIWAECAHVYKHLKIFSLHNLFGKYQDYLALSHPILDTFNSRLRSFLIPFEVASLGYHSIKFPSGSIT